MQACHNLSLSTFTGNCRNAIYLWRMWMGAGRDTKVREDITWFQELKFSCIYNHSKFKGTWGHKYTGKPNNIINMEILKYQLFQILNISNLSCKMYQPVKKHHNRKLAVAELPMLMAVSCLSPVRIQTLMSAFIRVSMVSGT